jgi:regulator of cell morphogenesis and NO signaling
MEAVMLHPDLTLAEIVDERAGSERVLERHGLDYCCGGRRSLAAACASTGVDPQVVLAELAAIDTSAEPEWTALSPGALADHVESTHHRYLHDELPRLGALVDKVSAVHGARHPELADVAATFAELRADLEPHLTKEERVLFPMIRQLEAATAAPAFPCGSVANPIRVMQVEHDRTGELLRRLRQLTGGYAPPVDGCATYRALYAGLEELEFDTHLPVHKENDVLYPAAVAREAAL